MVFPVVKYGCESWTTKKAEHQRIDAFELWCWRRLLRVPWTARRSNQSILEEISPGCSLEGLMLKQKLQYFGHLMQRADSLEKTLMLRRTEGERRRGWQEDEMVGWHHRFDAHGFEQAPGVCGGQGGLACCSPWGRRVRDNWATKLNWTGCKAVLINLQWPARDSLSSNHQSPLTWVNSGKKLLVQLNIKKLLAASERFHGIWVGFLPKVSFTLWLPYVFIIKNYPWQEPFHSEWAREGGCCSEHQSLCNLKLHSQRKLQEKWSCSSKADFTETIFFRSSSAPPSCII